MTAQTLKKSLLNYAICGKLSANWRNSRIPTNSNSQILEFPKDFEPPFGIPNTWSWVKLGDIGVWKSGSTPRRTEQKYFNNGTINWLKTGDLNDDYIYETSEKITELAVKDCNLILYEKNTILIAMYGATTGKIGIASIPLTTNQACCACRCYEEKIFYRFLYFLLLNLKSYFISISFGGAQPNISKEKIINTYIPLPPKDEQEFIVNELEKLMRLADDYEVEFQRLEHCKKELKKLKKSILNYSISGKLSTKWRKENSRIPNDVKSRIPSDFNPPFEIPNSWQWVKLGDICNPKQWTTLSTDKLLENGKYNVYGANGIIGKYNEYNHEKETILITCRGATCGSINICEPFSYVNGNAFALNNLDENVCLKFMYFCLKGINFNDIITGTAQPQIVKKNLVEFYIPLPPLDEQEIIVKKIDELFEILELIENSL